MDRLELQKRFRERLLDTTKKNASGVLIKAEDTNRVLLLLRNEYAGNNTWSLVSGGMEKNENPLETIKREVKEELSINPDIIKYNFINKQYIPDKNLDFYYFQGFTPNEFLPKLDRENLKWGWFDKDKLPSPLFNKDMANKIKHI